MKDRIMRVEKRMSNAVPDIAMIHKYKATFHLDQEVCAMIIPPCTHPEHINADPKIIMSTQKKKNSIQQQIIAETQSRHAAMAMAGDEASTGFDGAGVTSPEWLFSLGTALLPFISWPGTASVGLVSLSPDSSAATWPSGSSESLEDL